MSEAHQVVGPAEPILHHHYVTVEQENEACTLGIWLFLAQEIMFFGGLFGAYGVYRMKFPLAWAEGSHQLSGIGHGSAGMMFGTLNTSVLLLSSLTMAMFVYSTQHSKWKQQTLYLIATMFLGAVFLFIKFYFEWTAKYEHGLIPGALWDPEKQRHANIFLEDPAHTQMFFVCYFIMTSMHALHIIIGIGVGLWLLWGSFAKKYGENRFLPIEFFGFYWHFVDVVWVFLFPLFYLVK